MMYTYGGSKKKMMMYGGKKKMMKAGGAKPDYLDMDGDGNKKEPMKNAVKDKKAKGKKKPFVKPPTPGTNTKPKLYAKKGGLMKDLKKQQKEDRKEMRSGQKEARKEQRGQNKRERVAKGLNKRADRKMKSADRKRLAGDQATAQGKLKKAARKQRKSMKKGVQGSAARLAASMYKTGGFLEMPTFDLDRD